MHPYPAAPRSAYPQPPAETAGPLQYTREQGKEAKFGPAPSAAVVASTAAAPLSAPTHRAMLQRALQTLAASITQLKAKPTAEEAAARATPSTDAQPQLHPSQLQTHTSAFVSAPSASTAATSAAVAGGPIDRKLAPVSLVSSSTAAGLGPTPVPVPVPRPLAFSAFAPISPSQFPEALRWEETKEQAPAVPVFAQQPHAHYTQQQSQTHTTQQQRGATNVYPTQQSYQPQSRYLSSPSHALPLTTAALSPPRPSPPMHRLDSDLLFISHTSFLLHHPQTTSEPVFGARSKPDALFSQRAPSPYATTTAAAARPSSTSSLLSRPASAPFVPPYPTVAPSSRPLSTTSSTDTGASAVLSSFARTLQWQRQQLERLDQEEDAQQMQQRPFSAQPLRSTNIHAPVFSHPSPTRTATVPSYAAKEGPAAYSSTIRAASQPYSQPMHRARDHDREEELEAAEHERTLQRLRDALQQTRAAVAASERASPVRSAAATPSLPAPTAAPSHYSTDSAAPHRALSRDLPTTNYLREYELKVPGSTAAAAARSPPKRAAAPSSHSAVGLSSGPPAQPSALDLKIQSTQKRAERVLREVDETLGAAKRRAGLMQPAAAATGASAKSTSPAPAINTWARMQAEMEREDAASLRGGGVRSSGSNYAPPSAASALAGSRLTSPLKPSPFAYPPDEAPARVLLADYLQRGAEAEKMHQARMASYGSNRSTPTLTDAAAPPRRSEWTGAAAAAAAASVAAAAAAAAAAEAARETPPPRPISVSSIRTPSPVHAAPIAITVAGIAAAVVRPISPPPAIAIVASPSHARVTSHTVSRVTDDGEGLTAPGSPARGASSSLASPASPIVSREDAADDDVDATALTAADEEVEEELSVDDSFSRMDQEEQERVEQQQQAQAEQRPTSPPKPAIHPASRVSPPKPQELAAPVAVAAPAADSSSTSEIEEDSFEIVPSEPASPAIAPLVVAAAVPPPQSAPSAAVSAEHDQSPEPTRLSPVKPHRVSPTRPPVAPLTTSSATFARSADPSSAEASFDSSYGDVPAAASPVPEVPAVAAQRVSSPRAAAVPSASLSASPSVVPSRSSSDRVVSPSSSLDVDHGSESYDGRSVAASDDVDADADAYAYDAEAYGATAEAAHTRGAPRSPLFSLASASTAEEFGWVEDEDEQKQHPTQQQHTAQEQQKRKDEEEEQAEMDTTAAVSPSTRQLNEPTKPPPQQAKLVDDAESSLDVSVVDSAHSEERAQPAPAAISPPSADLSRFSPPLVQPRAHSPPQSQPAPASPSKAQSEDAVEVDDAEIEEEVELNEEIEVEQAEDTRHVHTHQPAPTSVTAPIPRADTPEPEAEAAPAVEVQPQPAASPAASDEYDSEFPEFSPEPQSPPKQHQQEQEQLSQQHQQQSSSPPRSPLHAAAEVGAEVGVSSVFTSVRAPVPSADLSYDDEFNYAHESEPEPVATSPHRDPPAPQQQTFPRQAASSYEEEFGLEKSAAASPNPAPAPSESAVPAAPREEPTAASLDEIPDEIEESTAEDEPAAAAAAPMEPAPSATGAQVFASSADTPKPDLGAAPLSSVAGEDEFPPEPAVDDSSLALAPAAQPLVTDAEPPATAVVESAAESPAVGEPHAEADSTVPAAALATDAAMSEVAAGYYDANGNWIDPSPAAAAASASQQPYYDEASGLYYDPVSNCYWDDLQQIWVPWGSGGEAQADTAAAAAAPADAVAEATSADQPADAASALSSPLAAVLSSVDSLRDASDPLQFTDSPLPPTAPNASAASAVVAASAAAESSEIPDEIEEEPELEFEAAEPEAPSSADVSRDEFSPKRAGNSSSGKGTAAPRGLSAEAQAAADKRAADDARWAAEMKLIEDAQKVADAERESARRQEQEQDEARRAQREQKRRDTEERRKQQAESADRASSAVARAEQDARDAATEAEKARALAAEANDVEIEEESDDDQGAAARFTAEGSLDDSLGLVIAAKEISEKAQGAAEKARQREELVNAITQSLLQDLTRESLEKPRNASSDKAKRDAAAAAAVSAASTAATDAPPPKSVSPHVRSKTLSSDLGGSSGMDEYADDHLIDDDAPVATAATETATTFHINLTGVTSGGASGGSSMTPIPSAAGVDASATGAPSTPDRKQSGVGSMLLHPSSASPPRSSLSSPTLSPRSSFPPLSLSSARDDRALVAASKLELAGRARLGDKIAERGALMPGSASLLQEEARSLCSSASNSPVVSPRLNQRALMQRRGEYAEHAAALTALPFDSPSRSSSGSGNSSPRILSPRSSGGASGGASPRSSGWPALAALAAPASAVTVKAGADKLTASLTDDLLAAAQADASEVHRARRADAAVIAALDTADTLESLDAQSFDSAAEASAAAAGETYEISHEDLAATGSAAAAPGSKAQAAAEAYHADSALNTSAEYADEWASAPSTDSSSKTTGGVAAHGPPVDSIPLGAPLSSSSSFLRSGGDADDSDYADDEFVDQRILDAATSAATATATPLPPPAPLVAGIETSAGFVRKFVRTTLMYALGDRTGASSSVSDADVTAGGGYAGIFPPSLSAFEQCEASRIYFCGAPADDNAPPFPSEFRSPPGSATPFPMAAQRAFHRLIWDTTAEAIEAYRVHWSRQRAEPWFQHQRLLGTVLATATAASPSALELEDDDDSAPPLPRIRTHMRQVGMERGYALVHHQCVPSRFDEHITATLRRIEMAVAARVARMLDLSRRTPTLGQSLSVAAAHVAALTAGSAGQSAPPTPANVKLPSVAASVTEHEMKIVNQAMHKDTRHDAATDRDDSPEALADLSMDSSDEWEQLEPRESIRLVGDLADKLLSDLLVSTCSMLKSVHNKRSSTQFSETMSQSGAAARGAGSRANRRSPVSNKHAK